MTSTKRLLAIAALALLAGAAPAALAGSAWAMGSDSSSDSSSAGSASTSDDYLDAQKKVKAEDYKGAIPLLEKVLAKEPGNADALNYLGYSHRKLGETDKALEYYLAALKSEPEHLGANEYLGELYLEIGDVAKAEERLAVLQQACAGCMEEAELAEKIAAFKAKSS